MMMPKQQVVTGKLAARNIFFIAQRDVAGPTPSQVNSTILFMYLYYAHTSSHTHCSLIDMSSSNSSACRM
jgi:hypothetical protein